MLGPLKQQKGFRRFTGVVANPKLILPRQWLRASTSLVVPAGAFWIIVRCEGVGGASAGSNFGGGGAAFAREDRQCSPGQTVGVNVSLGVVGSTPAATSVTLAGVTICLAANGSPATASSFGLGGLAANSIGTILASGGNGGDGSNPAGNGANGGAAGAASGPAGGGAGGEANALDALILGGRGAPPGNGRGEFPGGGAASFTDRGTNTAAPGGDGLASIEFWSAKP